MSLERVTDPRVVDPKLTIQISRVRENLNPLPLPQFMTSGASGCDVLDDLEKPLKIKPGERALIPTGIAIAIPVGYEAQMRPRSGLAWKWGVTLPNTPGTIDSDYRGEIKVPLINLGKKTVTISRGDRIAQMVFQKVCPIEWKEVQSLDETQRGEGGFGHTGVNQSERL
ncbi:MAG: dUTP diphosphatase [Deltaproteobacteria bacterium]|nr:dUTP diphosphatase [Deltaproteobacteria bacterium]